MRLSCDEGTVDFAYRANSTMEKMLAHCRLDSLTWLIMVERWRAPHLTETRAQPCWYRFSADPLDDSDDTEKDGLNAGAKGDNSDCDSESSNMLCGRLARSAFRSLSAIIFGKVAPWPSPSTELWSGATIHSGWTTGKNIGRSSESGSLSSVSCCITLGSFSLGGRTQC